MEVAVQLVALDNSGTEETLMLGKEVLGISYFVCFTEKTDMYRPVLYGLQGRSRRILRSSPIDSRDHRREDAFRDRERCLILFHILGFIS
jgi:hypothetical protein